MAKKLISTQRNLIKCLWWNQISSRNLNTFIKHLIGNKATMTQHFPNHCMEHSFKTLIFPLKYFHWASKWLAFSYQIHARNLFGQTLHKHFEVCRLLIFISLRKKKLSANSNTDQKLDHLFPVFYWEISRLPQEFLSGKQSPHITRSFTNINNDYQSRHFDIMHKE